LALQNRDFDNAYWSKANSAVTANAGTSPDGTTNADLFYATSNSTNSVLFNAVTSTVGTVYTTSIYLKASGKTWAFLRGVDDGVGAFFNLSTGTLGTVQAGVTATISAAGSGWYRCTVTQTASFTTSRLVLLVVDGNGSTAVTANGTNGLLIYGGQIEAGSYATSLILTTTVAVTRLADAAQKTSISSLLGQTEGVVYLETGACFNNDDTSATKSFIRVEKDANNWFGIGSGGASAAPAIRFVTNIAGTITTEGEPAGLSNSKIAFLYTSSSIKIYQNGALVLTVNKSIGNYAAVYFMVNSGDDMTMPLKEFLIFPTALSDAKCIEITTL
jgi:hypothetical protein